MKKDVLNNGEKDRSKWLEEFAEDFDYESMQSENILSEDPEFPVFTSKQKAKSSLYSDVERKKKEMDNSTIGGF